MPVGIHSRWWEDSGAVRTSAHIQRTHTQKLIHAFANTKKWKHTLVVYIYSDTDICMHAQTHDRTGNGLRDTRRARVPFPQEALSEWMIYEQDRVRLSSYYKSPCVPAVRLWQCTSHCFNRCAQKSLPPLLIHPPPIFFTNCRCRVGSSVLHIPAMIPGLLKPGVRDQFRCVVSCLPLNGGAESVLLMLTGAAGPSTMQFLRVTS